MGSLYPDQETNSSLTSDTPTSTGGLPVVSNIKFTPGGKGQIATMTSPTGVLMDENSSKSILANMQKLLEEKPFENFQNDLQKMYAWTKHDKEPMFRQLEEQRQQKEAQRYNIMQSMEALKSSQSSLQNKAMALLSPEAALQFSGQTGTGGAAARVAPKPQGIITPEQQAEIDKLILKDNNIAAAEAYKMRILNENAASQARLKYSADMLKQVPFMNPLTNKKDFITQADWVEYNKTRPEIAALISKANPGLAQTLSTPSATQGKTTAADWAVDNGFQVISGTRTPEESAKLVHHRDKNGVPRTKEGRPIDLETSGHFTGDAFDVKPGSVTPELDAKAAAAGYKRGTGLEENHFSRVKTGAPVAAAPMGNTPSMEEYEANIERESEFQKVYMKTTYEPLAQRVESQRNDIQRSKLILGSLQKGQFGPGASIDQALSTALQTIGLKGSPEEQAQYLNNLNIEDTRKVLATSVMREALGPQFTQSEGEKFIALTPGIDKPKELLKQYYQLRIAGAEADKAELNYLTKHRGDPGGLPKAKEDWDASGEKDRIIRKFAPIYSKIADRAEIPGETNKPVTSTGSKANAEPIDFNQLQKRKK